MSSEIATILTSNPTPKQNFQIIYEILDIIYNNPTGISRDNIHHKIRHHRSHVDKVFYLLANEGLITQERDGWHFTDKGMYEFILMNK